MSEPISGPSASHGLALPDLVQPASATSLTMLDRLRGNEARAWQRFVELYTPLVCSWLRRAGLRNEDVADLLQDVFVLVAGSVGRFQRRGPGAFRGWLWAVTRNKVRDHFRSRKGRPEAAGGTDAQQRLLAVTEPDDPSRSGLGDRLLHRGLELIRADFEGRTWLAFWRCTIDGHAAAEVATDLGMQVAAVYQAKARVLRRLRQELGDLLD
jgi:RNA polymerase sigma-70 factor, ECF subfamily